MGQLECILILQCSLLIALRKRYFCVVEFILNENREEKLLCAMVAKFLDDNKLKMSLKKVNSYSLNLSNVGEIVWGLNVGEIVWVKVIQQGNVKLFQNKNKWKV